MKYTPKIVKRICELIATDEYTVMEIAEQVGINRCTYYEWINNEPGFKEAIEEAEQQRFELFKKEARKGLLTLLRGKEYEEVTTEYEGKTKKIKSKKTIKKFILPNPTSVIFALKNVDKDNFKDVVRNELTGEDGQPINSTTTIKDEIDYSKIPTDILEAFVQAAK